MNRREFLTHLCVLPVGAAVVGPPAALAADSSGSLAWPAFKAGESGRLLASSDGGRTWQVNTNFGPETTVVGVTHDERYAYLRLACRGHEFTLTSADGRRWRTTP
jgi:hypothetical protein